MSSRSTDEKGVQRKVMGAAASRPHALLTGASSGIGRALAAELAAVGFSVSLVARDGERLRGVAAELDCPTLDVERDLTIPSAAGEWLPEVVQEMGPLSASRPDVPGVPAGYRDWGWRVRRSTDRRRSDAFCARAGCL